MPHVFYCPRCERENFVEPEEVICEDCTEEEIKFLRDVAEKAEIYLESVLEMEDDYHETFYSRPKKLEQLRDAFDNWKRKFVRNVK